MVGRRKGVYRSEEVREGVRVYRREGGKGVREDGTEMLGEWHGQTDKR